MIGLITQRELIDSHGETVDSLESNYISYFEALGIELRIVSNFHNDIKGLLNMIKYDLVILTGGGSIPSTDDNIHQQTNRNFIEREIIKDAINRKIPIIAICRAMQYINILYEGNVSKLNPLKVKRNIGQDHPVILANKIIMSVNNFHNYGIFKNDLAQNFDIVAIDQENQVIEAYYSMKYKVLGFQWHPERKFEDNSSKDITREIITQFIENRGILDESYYFSSWSGI